VITTHVVSQECSLVVESRAVKSGVKLTAAVWVLKMSLAQ